MNKEVAIQIAAEFIKKWERLGSKSPSGGSWSPEQAKNLPLNTKLYPFPDGKTYSIGWGTNNKLPSDGTPVTANLVIDKARADKEYQVTIYDKTVPVLDKLITAPLNEVQYAALISFMYNAGPYALKYNNLDDIINNGGDVIGILKRTALKDARTGKVLNGLINRRKDEAALYSGQQNALYSYYLRNATSINYGTVTLLVLGVAAYIYYLKYKKII